MCPLGQVLLMHQHNGNREWEPDPRKVECKGTIV